MCIILHGELFRLATLPASGTMLFLPPNGEQLKIACSHGARSRLL